jgi:hypothetical protein
MSNISCSASNCAYNKNNTCSKLKVEIEGMFSRSRLGTFCQSFSTPKEIQLSGIDFESKIQNEKTESYNIIVSCTSNKCLYYKDGFCSAEIIEVGMPEARFRSETQCDSFKLK